MRRHAEIQLRGKKTLRYRLISVHRPSIEPRWTEEILKQRGLKAPIGEVKALSDAQAPKK